MTVNASLRLVVLETPLSVCKVADASGVDLDRIAPPLFFAHTADELSLVCPSSSVPTTSCVEREDGWRALRVEGTLEFSLTGIIAGISSVLAASGVPVFCVSTFDTDYVLVKEDRLAQALRALDTAGYVL